MMIQSIINQFLKWIEIETQFNKLKNDDTTFLTNEKKSFNQYFSNKNNKKEKGKKKKDFLFLKSS